MIFPELWIVAGPNGAGKTTCAKAKPISDLLPDVPFLNPDDRTLVKLRSAGYAGFQDAPGDMQTRLFFESADEVFDELKQALAQKKKVGVETVLSSDKYRVLVDGVRKDGGIVALIYVALSSPSIAKERVGIRVQRGGHGIPDDKIEQRWKRSLDNLGWFAERATDFWVIDNSSSDPQTSPALVAWGKLGRIEYLDENAFPEMKAALASLKPPST
jgi:predicted ABC-type ATPase